MELASSKWSWTRQTAQSSTSPPTCVACCVLRRRRHRRSRSRRRRSRCERDKCSRGWPGLKPALTAANKWIPSRRWDCVCAFLTPVSPLFRAATKARSRRLRAQTGRVLTTTTNVIIITTRKRSHTNSSVQLTCPPNVHTSRRDVFLAVSSTLQTAFYPAHSSSMSARVNSEAVACKFAWFPFCLLCPSPSRVCTCEIAKFAT